MEFFPCLVEFEDGLSPFALSSAGPDGRRLRTREADQVLQYAEQHPTRCAQHARLAHGFARSVARGDADAALLHGSAGAAVCRHVAGQCACVFVYVCVFFSVVCRHLLAVWRASTMRHTMSFTHAHKSWRKLNAGGSATYDVTQVRPVPVGSSIHC